MEPPTNSLGKVSARPKKPDSHYIDLRPHGRIYSLGGVGFSGEQGKILALGVLRAIELAVGDGQTVEQAVSQYGGRERGMRIKSGFERFVVHIEELAQAGDRSLKTASEYRRILRTEIGWFGKRSLEDLDYATLEDWDAHLRSRNLSAKSRKNYMGAVSAACKWLARRGNMKNIPPFPVIEIGEHNPRILSRECVDFLLLQIPEKLRGPYLVAA